MIESRIRVICDRCHAYVDAPDGTKWPTIVSALTGATALGWRIAERLGGDREECPECICGPCTREAWRWLLAGRRP